MPDLQRRLGALLVEMGLVGEDQLERALDDQRVDGRRLGRVLVERGLVVEEVLVDALARQLGIERWVPAQRPSEIEARELLPRELAFKSRALPLSVHTVDDRRVLLLATSDPLAPAAGKVVRTLSERGLLVRWLLAGDVELEQALSSAYQDIAPGVTIIQGRPASERDVSIQPSVLPEPEALELAAAPAEAAEADLIEALDAALTVDPPSPAPPSSAAPVPALEVESAAPSGHTLLADDAVLEVIDDAPQIVSTTSELPNLGLGPEPSVPSRSISSEFRETRPEPVALARVAIRRREAIREVVPEALRSRDPRDPDSGSSPVVVPQPLEGVPEMDLEILPGSVPIPEAPLQSRPAPDDSVRTDDVFGAEPTVTQAPEPVAAPEPWTEADSTTLDTVRTASSEAVPLQSDLDSSDIDQIASIQATMIRFAAGESLPEDLREEVLRVVVAVLLERGWLDDAAVARVLKNSR